MKTAFPPLIDTDSKVLILGTMPGERSLELQQYYGHSGNHFWKIMFRLFGAEFSKDYSERTALLKSNRVALWDVLKHCEGTGSADTDIKNEIPNDFDVFHKAYPNIRYVIFASTQAEKFYNKYARRMPGIDYFRLPSPSGANASKSLEQKISEWQLIKKLLNEDSSGEPVYITQLIYVHEGKEAVFHEFENLAIQVMEKYNGKIIQRIRPDKEAFMSGEAEKPYEIHFLTFDSEADLAAFMKDETRKQFLHLKEESVKSMLLVKGFKM